jgi:predicted RND superfamily exporter protein
VSPESRVGSGDRGPQAVGRAAAALARRPRLGAASLLLLVAAAALGWLRGAPFGSFDDRPAWRAAIATHSDFDLGREATLLAVFGPVLEPEHEPELRQLERAVEGLPWVAEVVLPWDLPGLGARPLGSLREHPLVRDVLLDRQGRGLLLPLRWDGSAEWPEELDNDELYAAIAAAARAAAPSLDVGLTGLQPIITAQSAAIGRERWRFQLFGALLGFAIASLAFRDLRATFLAGLPPLIGVGVAIGVTRLAGFGAQGFTSIVLPLLVLTIGFTDSLHVVVRAARARRAADITGAEASARSLEELAWPCFLTSLTTAIGFASLAISGSTMVREFGLSCALATLVTFVCVVLLIPLLARTPLGAALQRVRPPSFESDPTEHGSSASESTARRAPGMGARIIDGGLRAALRAPRFVAAAAIAVTLGFSALASTLQVDRRASTDLAEGSEAAETLARVDRELGGAFPLHVRLDWDENVGGAAVFAAARIARRALAGDGDSTSSLVTPSIGPDLFADALRTTGDAPSTALDEVAWGALRALPERWTATMLDVDERRALVHARIPDIGSATLAPVFERIRAALVRAEQDGATGGVRLALVGTHLAYLETVTKVARELAQSLALAAVLILVTLALAFRSWRLGLASVVPNLLPIAASAAGLALVGGSVDISALTALTLSLGIATDDTIHVLARWRIARERGLDAHTAARTAVLRTLPALALTTLTLTAAFAQLLTSDLPTIREFGLLAATTLATAFVADVWLLPAFLVVTAPRTAA